MSTAFSTPTHVAIFGDSQPGWTHDTGDVTRMIQSLAGNNASIINCAVPGHNSESTLAYMPSFYSDFGDIQPDYSLLMIGVPTGQTVPISDFKDNIRSITATEHLRSQKGGKKLTMIIVTPTPLMPELMPSHPADSLRSGIDYIKQTLYAAPTISEDGTDDAGIADIASPGLWMSSLRKAVSNANTQKYAKAVLEVADELDGAYDPEAESGITRVIGINFWDLMVDSMASGTPLKDLTVDGMHIHHKGVEILEDAVRDHQLPGLVGRSGAPYNSHVTALRNRVPMFAYFRQLKPEEIAESYGKGKQWMTSYLSKITTELPWCLTTEYEENTDVARKLSEYP